MKILCAGVNHRSAPLEWRERLTMDREAVSRALAWLRAKFPGAEFAVLSTCNRVEVYAAAPADGPPEPGDLLSALAELSDLPADALADLGYHLGTEESARHLMEVAASLDSMVVGESQIINQTKQAFLQAVEAEAAGKYLSRLFHRAFHAAKRVQAATDIGRRRTSVASVAVEFASRIFSGLEAKRVLVIGAGEMAERAIVHLRSAGCRAVTVVNRTASRAEALAEAFRAASRPWEALDECLADSDIVVTSTASQQPILSRDRMAEAHRRRRYANWLILDLAVPRDVDPAVGRLRNVYLYDLDALGEVVAENLGLREKEIDLATAIVADEVQAFMDWFAFRDAGPLVEKLESHLHEVGDEELTRLLKRLPPEVDEAARNEIRLATHRIVHKLLHEPIARLKEEARQGRGQAAMRLLGRLFNLEGDRDDG